MLTVDSSVLTQLYWNLAGRIFVSPAVVPHRWSTRWLLQTCRTCTQHHIGTI